MDIFSALRKIFSTGLLVSDIKNDSIKIIDTQRSQAYSKRNTFMTKLHRNQLYQSSLSQNYSINRLALYRDYDMMDADPIISSALDVYVFEALTKDEYGNILKISSDNDQVVDILKQLFYQRLNCQFTFNVWFRNFVKYGDFFLALRIDDKLGIIGCQPISSYDMERIEDDRDNPEVYFFKFMTGGNQLIDNYNIAHFRLLNDTNFLPYGRSVLQPARRIWKNLSLMIDAMMIQRIMRAPERRVFKVDVGDLANEQVGPYMTDVINKMKKVPYKDPNTGQINLKYNIQNLLQDFFIPVRGKEDGSSIQTLAGMQNSFIQDINFVKSYMMAALKIPKAFLSFQQGIEAKCFAPYTRIKLLDGRILTIKEISQIFQNNPNVLLQTLTFDLQKKLFVPTTIKWCQKTRLNAEMVRVYLDNETSVDVTPDHNFILSDGSYCQAKDLKQNTPLQGFDINKEYELLINITQECESKYNHKVIKVQLLTEKMDTYNLQVNHPSHNILLYDNGIVVKQSTLSALDIIFARFIQTLQNLFVNQLYRVALIHLFILGYTDIDDISFKLELNNPSNVKKIQQMELWNQKIDLGTKMEESGQFDLNFIYNNIYNIPPQEAKLMLKHIISDKKYRSKLAMIQQGQMQGGGEEGYQSEGEDEYSQAEGQEAYTQESPEQEVPESVSSEGEQQVEQELKDTSQYQGEPLTNKFKGNSPLHLG